MSIIENPRLVERKRGGWLALTPADQSLQFGVTHESEEGARFAYAEALTAWRRTLATRHDA